MLKELTVAEARELEAWWDEFFEDHADEIAEIPQAEFERWRGQAKAFVVKFLRMSDAEKRDFIEQLDKFMGYHRGGPGCNPIKANSS